MVRGGSNTIAFVFTLYLDKFLEYVFVIVFQHISVTAYYEFIDYTALMTNYFKVRLG